MPAPIHPSTYPPLNTYLTDQWKSRFHAFLYHDRGYLYEPSSIRNTILILQQPYRLGTFPSLRDSMLCKLHDFLISRYCMTADLSNITQSLINEICGIQEYWPVLHPFSISDITCDESPST